MIKRDIEIVDYEWTVHCYIAVRGYLVGEIISELERLGCRGKHLKDAEDCLRSGHLDGGLTYSDLDGRETVMVIGMASDVSQYLNTIAHEALHVVQHVCERMAIDLDSEEPCYIMGGLVQALYNEIKNNPNNYSN